MDDLAKQASELKTAVDGAWHKLSLDERIVQLETLQAESQKPDFWNDSTHAQSVMKQIAQRDEPITQWTTLRQNIADVIELTSVQDTSIRSDLEQDLQTCLDTFNSLKTELKFNGPYDNHNAILGIHAGAGGSDAQDWAQMLLRMYSRYFEKSGWQVSIIDESTGEEGGLKSVTLEVNGPFAYGKLKGEHGVHRLVRLSPFNAESRETSFAKVEIMPKIDQPNDLIIDEKDLKIDVYRSGGKGGQSVNTTDSAVRITHLQTGITVAIQNERSQLQNRETAMTILRSRLAQLQLEQHQEKLGDLKGPNQSAEWGNQIRSYVLHPYKQVKDLRSRYETSDPDAVLDGDLNPLIDAYLEHTLSN